MAKHYDSLTEFVAGLPPVRPSVPLPTAVPKLREPSFFRVLLAWELLRLLYNVPMVLIFLFGFSGPERAGRLPLERIAFGCVYLLIVNVPFCLCHVFEVYLCWLGMRRSIARYGIFILVTGTIGGALASLLFLK